jgi:hypothetical protein
MREYCTALFPLYGLADPNIINIKVYPLNNMLSKVLCEMLKLLN